MSSYDDVQSLDADWAMDNTSTNGEGTYVDNEDGYVMIDDDDDDDSYYGGGGGGGGGGSGSTTPSKRGRATGIGSRGPYKKSPKNVRERNL